MIVSDERRGSVSYSSYMECLIARYNEGVYHYDNRPYLVEEVEAVIGCGNERFAQIFLEDRSGIEYEGITDEENN